MKIIAALLLTVVLAVTPAFSQAISNPTPNAAKSAWPDTDAGRMASAWVKAVNANDLATYQEFVSSHFSAKRLRGHTAEEVAKQHVQIHQQVTPLKLVAVT